jgi:F-type H+-transporting ATPase subunit a
LDNLILAAEGCDPAEVSICTPENILEFFEFEPIFGPVNRTVILIFLAAVVVIALLYFAYRTPRDIPSKFQLVVDGMVRLVRDDIAKYTPYLLSLFMFILVGNFFGLTPFINFPIGSRMAIPMFLSLMTYVIFVVAGFRAQGFGYIGNLIWPPGVPIALRPLIGVIELVSVLLIRPFSLAVRLFANLVAGHTMLSLLLASGVIFIGAIGEIGFLKGGLVGGAWFVFGMAIFVLEILVSLLQAYIFTLLSAVYIQTSIHAEH